MIHQNNSIYIDGVFDIVHSGHFNAIRQAKKLTDYLYVGVNSDEGVTKVKGSPLLDDDERIYLISGCKWANKIIGRLPYTPTIELLDSIGAFYAAHGDDIAIDENGEDCYSEFRKVNRMKVFKRTEGVSTTDLIGRLLSIGLRNAGLESEANIYKPIPSKFLSTGRRLKEFCNDKIPKKGDVIVYIDGVFDVLHPGIINFLEISKSKGDFLYVGIYDNETSRRLYGKDYPILSLQERVFNMLALKYVDDVIIGSPDEINDDMILTLNLSKVLGEESIHEDLMKIGVDPYVSAKKRGIFELVKASYKINNDFLIDRVMKRKDEFTCKYIKKHEKEEIYYKEQKVVINEI